MNPMVENVLKSYFVEHQDAKFGKKTSLIRYKRVGPIRTVTLAELRYQLAVGHIVYRNHLKKIKVTEKWLTKYFETASSEGSLLTGCVPFFQELHFFQTVLPVFDQMEPTKHLFVRLCTSYTCATPSSNQSTIVWDWPKMAATFTKASAVQLSYTGCSLMLKKIGHFHARSLQLQSIDEDLFEKMNFTCPSPAHFNTDLVLPVLVRCLQRLRETLQSGQMQFRLIRRGLSRLQQLLDDFDQRLRVPFARATAGDGCWVMCHQNYGQESVIFEQTKKKQLVDLKIFNCQSMGFASLGVDLAIPLLVELSALSRDAMMDSLVREYLDELQKTDMVDLTVKSVIGEIKKAVPFALYTLASRILEASEVSTELQCENTFFKASVWKEELIVDLYRFLILEKYI